MIDFGSAAFGDDMMGDETVPVREGGPVLGHCMTGLLDASLSAAAGAAFTARPEVDPLLSYSRHVLNCEMPAVPADHPGGTLRAIDPPLAEDFNPYEHCVRPPKNG
ncbi:MAG TPA: hypothetical protein PLK94_05960 [Alphaproteobacteria bacterium]|nr:hypothetical protein [Alphaproteobacteria bacterium]HOO50819.1 hypothetical protein [Alphaproteobacteria bacterium]